ncbi:hypothetical protein FQP85_21925 [Pseudoalteromonas neustonica]|uniref:Uncharacterized protein n=1 Tax=Pseudoalteromonas neustonica TaxID=1840331 RepID=A0ABY3F7A8_9GAMM|nr:hypothetical protein [Pseudoalteromonas neustonica]TVU79855.1 hypothetical protein FQP85_21925 [Pseudoalteromonas neustonica]
MADKVSIVYIGNKPKKKDTVCCTRLVFTRNVPIPVDADLAARFLDYPKVWVAESELKGVLEAQEKAAKEEEKARLAREEAEKQAELDANLVVIVDGEEVDLGKYNTNQLTTFAEAHDLVIEGSKKPLPEYKLKIRDAFRALSGDGEGEE